MPGTECKHLFLRSIHVQTSEIRYYLCNDVRVHFFSVPISRQSSLYKYPVSYRKAMEDTTGIRANGQLHQRSVYPDVTSNRSDSLGTLYRESRASLGRLDFLCLVKQTTMTDSTGRGPCTQEGGSYQVISLSQPCLGDNYRRTTPRDVFPRFSADWQNVSSVVWSLKATWRKYESVLLPCYAL